MVPGKKKFFFDTIGFQFLVRNVLGGFFLQDLCSPGGMGTLGSWVVEEAKAATYHRTSKGSTGRASARLSVEHSSPWLSLNLEWCGPGEMNVFHV